MARILLLLTFLFSTSLWAQQMEIIELRSKNVEEVLPALLPLVEPGGTLTGMNNQLFLKASPRNRADIKRALASIDTPTRRLIIRITSRPGSGIQKACVAKVPRRWCRPSKAVAPSYRLAVHWLSRCVR